MNTTHAFITYVADRAASREIEALADFYGVGTLIVSGEISYEAARDQMVTEFKARNLAASTVKVYLSQGHSLAQLFDTFADVETFADDECGGSRSLKRIYDAVKGKPAKAASETPAEGATNEADTAPAALIDVILANLASLTDAGEIARVRDAAAAMLTVKAA